MKGIVMDKSKNKMIVMNPNGTFIDMKLNKSVDIGQEIEITQNQKSARFNKFYKYASIAAASIMLLVGGINVKAYYTPYSYMNIDINPSIQLELNKFDRVIDVEALNNDGQTVLNDLNVKNLKVEDATEDIVETAVKHDYIKKDIENSVMVSIYNPNNDNNNNEDIKLRINSKVNKYLQQTDRKVSLVHEVVSKQDFARARQIKISPGKLMMYDKIQKIDPKVTLDEVKKMPVRDIVKIIKQEKKDVDNKDIKDIKDAVKKEFKRGEKPVSPDMPDFEDKTKKPDKPEYEKAESPEYDKPDIERESKDNYESENKQNEFEKDKEKISSDISDSKDETQNIEDEKENVDSEIKGDQTEKDNEEISSDTSKIKNETENSSESEDEKVNTETESTENNMSEDTENKIEDVQNEFQNTQNEFENKQNEINDTSEMTMPTSTDTESINSVNDRIGEINDRIQEISNETEID